MALKPALCSAAVLLAFSVHATEKLNEYDVRDALEDEKATWQEVKAELPAYPKSVNLIQVQAGTPNSHRYFIDATSLSRGKDGVMRYSAVVKAAGGAENVSFEGIRCETRERKIYALGHADGTWQEARDASWRRIERFHPPLYLTLWRDYFCPERTAPTRPTQALDAIKRGTPIASGPSSY
jgi:hypothetical protein